MKAFNELVEEAWLAPFTGWDFSWERGRVLDQNENWDYAAIARERLSAVQSALDMDTGGGELLSSLGPFPPHTFATESYPPNVPIARARLEPLGIQLFDVEENRRLPFADGQIELVLNRHGSYNAQELSRVLAPGGRLLTQQVGGKNHIQLNELLQDEPSHPYAHWTLDYARRELVQAGFEILQAREDFPETVFLDIGALVYHLKVISWQIEGFEPGKFRDRLAAVDARMRREGGLTVRQHRFLIEARKP